MNKYFLALAFIFMLAIQGYKSMQEEIEMEIEEEQPNGKSAFRPPTKRPEVCTRKDKNKCAMRMQGAPKYQCQCKKGRFCPPFPKK
jgi:hypothetical protein